MCNEFGYGKVYPYNLLMTIEKSNYTTVLSQEFFNTATTIVNTLVSKVNWTDAGDVTGITNIPFPNVEGPQGKAGIVNKDTNWRLTYGSHIGCLNQTYTSANNVSELCTPINFLISSFGTFLCTSLVLLASSF